MGDCVGERNGERSDLPNTINSLPRENGGPSRNITHHSPPFAEARRSVEFYDLFSCECFAYVR